MELRTYLEILWRRKVVILITAIVTTLIVAVGAYLLPPTYEATTALRVTPSGGLSVDYTALTYANQIKNTFLRLATSDKVLDDLTERLDLDAPPEVEMEILGNSELMLLTVRHHDRQMAQKAANTLAEILLEVNRELYVRVQADVLEILGEQLVDVEGEMQDAWDAYQVAIAESPEDAISVQAAGRAWELKEQEYTALLARLEETRAQEVLRANALSIFDPAELPERPAGLPRAVYVALGAVIGLVAGVGLAFLFENLDTTLHTTEQIETVTQAPVIGRIPTLRNLDGIRISDGNVLYEEAIRRLRTNVYALAGPSAPQVLLLASAEPQEGKTTIVVNLASAMAESGRKVVAVDCDLRLPRLHSVFGLSNDSGLSSALQKQATLDAVLQTTDVPGLQLICAGPTTMKPTELLCSQYMSDVIEELRQRFDLVLLDTPAVSAVVDAAILAPRADGVLLVVERAKTNEESVRSACGQFASVGATLLGVIVNKAIHAGSYRYYTELQRSQPQTTLDALTKIRGIGPIYERALRALGITTFALLGEQEAEHLATDMGVRVSAKRIQNEHWIEQARRFSGQKGYNEPAAGEDESRWPTA